MSHINMADQEPSILYEQLLEAARDKDTDTFETLLAEHNLDINHRFDNEYTLLHFCVGFYKSTLVLLNKKANANVKGKDGLTPLHLAAREDYQETVLLLVKHGAAIDDEESEVDSPLKMAVQQNAASSKKLLMILGADYKCLSDDVEEKEEQTIISRGYREGRIRFGWDKVTQNMTGIPQRLYQTPNISHVLLEMRSHGDDFDIFCRREDTIYLNCSDSVHKPVLQEDETFITDIFRYSIHEGPDVKCDVIIPLNDVILEKNIRYKTLFLRTYYGDDHTEDFPDCQLESRKVTVQNVKLLFRGCTTFDTFVVIAKDKKETFVTKDKPVTIESKIDADFKVTLPPSGPSGSRQFSMTLLPVEATDTVREELDGTSAFCQVSSESQDPDRQPTSSSRDGFSRDLVKDSSKQLVDLQLPAPESSKEKTDLYDSADDSISDKSDDVLIPDNTADAKTYVMTCQEGSAEFNASNWSNVHYVQKQQVLIVKKPVCGIYIVIKTIRSIGERLKVIVRNLYESVKKGKVSCFMMSFYKVIKENENRFQFLVRVVIEKTKLDRLGDGFDDFVKSEADTSIELRKRVNYCLHCGSNPKDAEPEHLPYMHGGTINDYFVIQYNEAVSSFHTKVKLVKNCKIHKKQSGTIKTSLPVIGYTVPLEKVPSGQFLSDEFLESLIKWIGGPQWFEMGVYLGFSFKHLSRLEDCSTKCKYTAMLKEWRQKYLKETTTEPLTRMLQVAQLIPLDSNVESNLLNHVEAFMYDQQDLREWHSHITKKTYLTFDPVCPSSDIFIYLMAKELCPCELLLLEMGVKVADFETEKRNYVNDYRRIFCKLLDWVKVKKCKSNNILLLELVMKTFKNNGGQLYMDNLAKQLKPWLDKVQNDNNKEAKKIVEILTEYKCDYS